MTNPQWPAEGHNEQPPTEPAVMAYPSPPHPSDPGPGRAVPPEPMPGEPLLAESAPAAEGRRRRLPVLVAAATVFAVVFGATAYAGLRLWYGSGAQPEEATPASAGVFVRLDLSPGYGQRLKLDDLIKKFPSEDGEDPVDELETAIFDAFDIKEEDYRTHVEPWFGKRIGLALWADSDKRPYELLILNSDDDAKARAGLEELRRNDDDLGFVVRDGHALIARGDDDAQAAAEAAAAEAGRENLAESDVFRRGTGWLPGQQTGLAWVDLERLASFTDGFGLAASKAADGLKGQLIVGMKAIDNGIEFRLRSFGTDVEAPTGDLRSTVDKLPADTALAAALRVPDLASQARFADLLPEGLPGADSPITVLSSATVTVALSALGDDFPRLFASAETSSPEAARFLGEALEIFGGPMKISTEGNRVEVKTEGYFAGAGTLSGHARYRQALADVPERAYVVLYADLERLLAEAELDEKERRQMAPLKAVGFAAGTEDGDVVGLLRVIIE